MVKSFKHNLVLNVAENTCQTYHLNLMELEVDEYQVHVKLQSYAKLNLILIGLGEIKARLNLKLDLVGFESELNLFGAIFLTGQSELVIKSGQNHIASQARSAVKLRVVLAEKAKIDYRGTIYIAEVASQTVANQEHKSLVLNRAGEVVSEPKIEVLNTDVQCGHGSAIGRLEQDELFYLMAKGLDQATSTDMLVCNFLAMEIFEYKLMGDWIGLINSKRVDCSAHFKINPVKLNQFGWCCQSHQALQSSL